jgi:hypothetical protein
MPKNAQTSGKASSAAAQRTATAANAKKSATMASDAKADAEALLKADHRKVEQLFQQYEKAAEKAQEYESEGEDEDNEETEEAAESEESGNSGEVDQRSELAEQICRELIVHTRLEEELFYPACREKDVDDDDLDEAQVEHDGAKVLIAELMEGSPEDEYYDAKVKVLSEYIKHHVNEEERPGTGILAKARKAGVDMAALGAKIQARKAELMEQIERIASRPPQPRTLQLSIASGGERSRTYGRGEYGRSMSDDERGYGRSSRGYGNDWRSNMRDRDERGRFISEDDEDGSSWRRASRGRDYGEERDPRSYGSSRYDRDRDEQGRFMSDDDHRSGSPRGGRGGGQSGWYGDPRGHSEAAERGWEGRSSSRRSSRDYDEAEDYRSRSRGGERGRGGWFGDPEGHSEAAERGWEGRSSSSRGRSRNDEDDDRRGSSRSGRGGGHGGWYGDARGHSEAARRGWEDR